jgi:ABC-type phosphate transport system substrate-binding protein/serine/threonine protein kinase
MPSSNSFYPEYPCSYNHPLNCDRPLQTSQELKGAKFCMECGFPATLSEKAEIKGNLGNYQINNYVGVRGYGRLYSGTQTKDKQPVEIKEYILPNRCFNQEETRYRQETFQRIGGIKLADSRIQNFRLVDTLEAIANEKSDRCYLISRKIEASQTLQEYLTHRGKMTAPQVRELLNQTLQTLEFLHSQKIRFPSGRIDTGIAHGNISLDSILIQISSSANNQHNNQQFYTYLCDLAIWERLFIPPKITQPAPPDKEQDLASLGLVAFYLLAGRTTDYTSNQPLNPRDNQQWSTTDQHLKQFIERLLGINTPFPSAEAARQALMQLPKEDHINDPSRFGEDEQQKPWFKKWTTWLIILFLLLLGGGIFAYFWSTITTKNECSKYLQWTKLKNNFQDVNNVPTGIFNYTGEKTSTWSSILKQKLNNIDLEAILNNPTLKSPATFPYTPVNSLNLASLVQTEAAVTTEKQYFAITSLTNNLLGDLDQKPIAYDGLLVYVEFRKKNNNTAQLLNGQITLEQLRQIYTGKITNWQQINNQLPSLRIKPFAPTEPEALIKFQEIVLKNDPQDIALFRANNTQTDTTKTLNQIRQEILQEQNTGVIGFGIISKIKGQCSVYPLAIIDGNNQPIQPLFRKLKRRPLKTSDDLCDHDDYFFNVETFQKYPLGYRTFVVYPKDNSLPPAGLTFAEMLTTRQGQDLLKQVGLVPLQPIPDDITKNACKMF